MLEFIGFCAVLYLLIRFGGSFFASVLHIFLALVLFFLTLPILLIIINWLFGPVMVVL